MEFTELGVRVVSRGAVQELDALEHASNRAGSAGERMVSIFESVKRKLEVLGVAFGIREALRLANDIRDAADQYEKLGAVAQRVGAIHGITAKQIQTVEQALRAQDASMIDARNTSVALLTANIDLSNATKLLAVAQDIAASTNLSETDAMNDLILAMQTGMDRTLKHAGVQLDLQKAVDRTAASLGVATSQLSQHRIEQIRLTAILQAATQIQGAHAAALNTAAGRAEEASKVFSDLKLIFGTLISNAVTGSLEWLAGMLRGMRDWVRDDTTAFFKLVDAIKAVAVGVAVAGAAWLLYTGYAKAAAAITAIIATAETVATFFELAKGITSMADAMALFELAAAPVLTVIAAIGAVVAYKFFSREIKQQVEDFTKSVFGLGDALKNVGNTGADGAAGNGIQSSTAALQRLADMKRDFPGIIQGFKDIASATRIGSDETTKETERQTALSAAIATATKGLVGHAAAAAADLETQKAHAQWSAEDAARIRDQARAIEDQVRDAEHQVQALGLVGRALEVQTIRWKEAKAVQDAYRSGFNVDAQVDAAHRVAAAELEVLDVTQKQLTVRNLLSGAEDAFASFFGNIVTQGAGAFRTLADTVKNIFAGVVSDIAKQFFEMKILPKLASVFGLDASSEMAIAATKQVAAGGTMLTASAAMVAAANTMAAAAGVGGVATPTTGGAQPLPPVSVTGGGHSWTQIGGVAGAGLGVGYGLGQIVGSAGGGAIAGAAGGAATGAMLGSVLPGVGTAVGALVGGLAGLAGGLFGGAKAAREAAEAMKQLHKDYDAATNAFKHNDLATALAQNAAQAEQLRAQAEKLFGSMDRVMKMAGVSGTQLDKALADIAAQEAQNAALIRKQVAEQQQYAQEDLNVRNLRATGHGTEADQLAFKDQQQREYQAALDKATADGVIDNTEQLYLNTLKTTQNNELIAFLNGTLTDAVRNAPSGFRPEDYGLGQLYTGARTSGSATDTGINRPPLHGGLPTNGPGAPPRGTSTSATRTPATPAAVNYHFTLQPGAIAVSGNDSPVAIAKKVVQGVRQFADAAVGKNVPLAAAMELL